MAFIVHLCPCSAHTPRTTMYTHNTPRCLPSAPHATPGATRSAGGAAAAGAAGGEAGGGSGPAMEKRNIFSLFRLWLNRQGGSAALQALVAQADTGSGGGTAQGGATGAGDGLLDIGEVQQLLMKVGVKIEWARKPLVHIVGVLTAWTFFQRCGFSDVVGVMRLATKLMFHVAGTRRAHVLIIPIMAFVLPLLAFLCTGGLRQPHTVQHCRLPACSMPKRHANNVPGP